jgi:tetratricopeptide (TPR) repeat protein
MNEAELLQHLALLQRQLNILREREAKAANNAPLDLLNQIDDHKQAISLVKAALEGRLSPEEMEQQLERLDLSLNRRGTEIFSGDKIEGDKSFIKVVMQGIPTRLVLGLLAVGIIAAVWAWFRFVPDKMPLNGFNVAVAEFGREDSQGNISPSADGRNLSEWMFGQLRAEYRNLQSEDTINIWHDSLGIFSKRQKIGLITGRTRQERQAAAETVARNVGADMVIYGYITGEEDTVGFAPEIYLRKGPDADDEIVGRHALGHPVEIPPPPLDLYDTDVKETLDRLQGRVTALVWLTRGLVKDLVGNHYGALQVFKQAETALQRWEDRAGKDVLYYFIGRQALFLSNTDIYPDRTPAEVNDYLNMAKEYFQQATSINESYRYHIGLGGVYFEEAEQLFPEEQLQTGLLDLAIEEYRLAIEGARDPAEPLVEIKGQIGLGLAFRLKGDAYLRTGQYDQAGPAFDEAIEEIQTALDLLSPDQPRLAAQAYLGLGAAFEGKAWLTHYIHQDEKNSKELYESALQAYDLCVVSAKKNLLDKVLKRAEEYCQIYSAEVDITLTGL